MSNTLPVDSVMITLPDDMDYSECKSLADYAKVRVKARHRAIKQLNAYQDLLKALEDCADMIETQFTKEIRDAIPEWYDFLTAARDAIAKTESK